MAESPPGVNIFCVWAELLRLEAIRWQVGGVGNAAAFSVSHHSQTAYVCLLIEPPGLRKGLIMKEAATTAQHLKWPVIRQPCTRRAP